ncbi:MAG: hypothetical protein P8Y17_00585 [Patescibacteria group bacterium]
MKKYFSIIISFLLGISLFSFSSNEVFATSGCCSKHQGVDCIAGPQANGKVICNDGSRNSSCYYSEMVMCEGFFNSTNNTVQDLESEIEQYEAEIENLKTESSTPIPTPESTIKPTVSSTPKPTQTPSPTPTEAPSSSPGVKGESVEENPPSTPTATNSDSESPGTGTRALGWSMLAAIYWIFRKRKGK